MRILYPTWVTMQNRGHKGHTVAALVPNPNSALKGQSLAWYDFFRGYSLRNRWRTPYHTEGQEIRWVKGLISAISVGFTKRMIKTHIEEMLRCFSSIHRLCVVFHALRAIVLPSVVILCFYITNLLLSVFVLVAGEDDRAPKDGCKDMTFFFNYATLEHIRL